jgi:hypothetical protein
LVQAADAVPVVPLQQVVVTVGDAAGVCEFGQVAVAVA